MVQKISQHADGNGASSAGKLSYKFQRLREQIRQAIVGGAFRGRLPGERELGRRFGANAKTINKALCDLSSEGLLVRIIGRGTFLADKADSAQPGTRPMIFHVLDGVEREAPTHRKVMLNTLRAALQKFGHHLELVPHGGRNDRDGLPASAWPAPLRRVSGGLIFYPRDVLGSSIGHPGDELLAAAWRRHIPVVLLAATADGAKVNTVTPDYADAGFRIGEHLFMLGCERIVVLRARVEGRDADRIAIGCRTAAMRNERRMVELTMERGTDWVGGLMGDSSPTDPTAGGEASTRSARAASSKSRRPGIGLCCVGRSALSEARSDPTIAELVSRGEMVVTCVLEPGDALAEEVNITSYDFNIERIVGWAARLLTDFKPGQRPVEVIVPGELKVRGVLPGIGRPRARQSEPGVNLIPSAENCQLAEAVI